MKMDSKALAGFFSIVIIGILIFTSGCKSPNFGCPKLDAPRGDINSQRKQYSRFDPFPDPNIGPGIPEFRPADYQDPAINRGEVSRKWVKEEQTNSCPQ